MTIGLKMDDDNQALEVDLNLGEDSSNLFTVWEKYQEFELFNIEDETSGSVTAFINEWQRKMCSALAMGCQYSETILAFKLLEKVNLDFLTLKDIIASLEYPSVKSNLLAQTIHKIKSIKGETDQDEKKPTDGEIPTRERKPCKRKKNNFIAFYSIPSMKKSGFHANGVVHRIPFTGPKLGMSHDSDESVKPEAQLNEKRDTDTVIDEAKVVIEDDLKAEVEFDDVLDDVDMEDPPIFDDEQENDDLEDVVGPSLPKTGSQCPKCKKTMRPSFNANKQAIDKYVCNYCNSMLYVNMAVVNKVRNMKNKTKEAEDSTKPEKVSRILKCDICQQKFTKVTRLKSHRRTHFEDRTFTCVVCSVAFDRRRDFRAHRREHPGVIVYTCANCEAEFLEFNQYKQHREEQHKVDSVNPEGDFGCCDCPLRYTCLSDYQEHRVSSHSPPPNSEHQCDTCGKAYRTKTALKYHTRVHTDERPFVCEVCHLAFHNPGNLKGHMKTHTGEKPHECNVCGKLFALKHSLMLHTRTHTGEKPYTCQYCSRSFGHKNTLRNHIRLHTGEKPFACHLCSRTFKIGNALNRHLRTHTGEKPYVCPVCSHAFPFSDKLKKHMRRHAEKSEDHKQALANLQPHPQL